jgi:two-component system chemotaxis sensor kinase CheA
MEDSDLEFKNLFLQEAEDLLVEAENTSFALEDESMRSVTIDKLFRLVHNFKGSAKAVGFNELSNFSHKFEDLLTQIKTGNRQLTKKVVRVILEGLDVLKAYVIGLKKDLKFTCDTQVMIDRIVEILKSANSEENTSDMQVPEHQAARSEAHRSEAHRSEAPLIRVIETQNKIEESKDSNKSEKKNSDEESLRVSTRKLDALLNLIGELVVNQSMLKALRERASLATASAESVLDYQNKVISEVQSLALSLRMNSIKPIFQKMRRIVRDLADNQEKEIRFISEGEEVEIDKSVFEKISDPLTHILRNSVDHGIENKEERAISAKDSVATVRLSAIQREDHVTIVISDDGRGMDPQKLIQKAIEKKLINPSSQLSDQEALALIFKPGFSTKEAVTDISGRGVGMDVVKTTVDALSGQVNIRSTLGVGSTFEISIPLTLSIISGMVVSIGNEKYVVPMSQLVETIRFDRYPIDTSGGKNSMLNLRGEIMPIISLRKTFRKSVVAKVNEGRIKAGIVALCDNRKFSFEVDEIIGQQQIVLKPLGKEVEGLPGIIAGAVLSDGDPGLVLSLKDFVRTGAIYAS